MAASRLCSNQIGRLGVLPPALPSVLSIAPARCHAHTLPRLLSPAPHTDLRMIPGPAPRVTSAGAGRGTRAAISSRPTAGGHILSCCGSRASLPWLNLLTSRPPQCILPDRLETHAVMPHRLPARGRTPSLTRGSPLGTRNGLSELLPPASTEAKVPPCQGCGVPRPANTINLRPRYHGDVPVPCSRSGVGAPALSGAGSTRYLTNTLQARCSWTSPAPTRALPTLALSTAQPAERDPARAQAGQPGPALTRSPWPATYRAGAPSSSTSR